MKVTYIKIFVDYLDAVEPLGDAERGRLFTALMQYAKSGEVLQLSGNERFIFPMMKAQIDRDIAALEDTAQKRSKAGRASAEMRKKREYCGQSSNEPDQHMLTHVESVEQNEHMSTKLNKANKEKDEDEDEDEDEEKDEDYDEEKDKHNRGHRVPQRECACAQKREYSPEFRTFWEVYPRKTDKAMAYKMYCARLKDGYAPDELLTAARLYADECHKDKRDTQYIKLGKTFLGPSTPFADYLGEDADDEYFPPSPSDEDVEQYKKFLEDTGQCQTV